MVQSYSPGCANVPLTCGHIGTTWQMRLNLCFLWLSAIFCTADDRLLMGMPGHVLSPNNCPFTWVSGPPSNTWFLGPIRVHNPYGISVGWTESLGSAVFAQITTECPYTLPKQHRDQLAVFAGLTSVTDRPLSVCNNRPHLHNVVLQCRLIIITSGQSHLTWGHIAAAHRWFSCVRHGLLMCTPI